jgi:hypothetical protein
MDDFPCLNRGVREVEIANDGRSRSVTGHVVKSHAVVVPANCCNIVGRADPRASAVVVSPMWSGLVPFGGNRLVWQLVPS